MKMIPNTLPHFNLIQNSHLMVQTLSNSNIITFVVFFFFFFPKIKLSPMDKDLQLLKYLKEVYINSKEDNP